MTRHCTFSLYLSNILPVLPIQVGQLLLVMWLGVLHQIGSQQNLLAACGHPEQLNSWIRG